MKFKMLLFTGCMLLLSGFANAQFNAGFFYNEECQRPALSNMCGFAGDPLPDGTNVEVYWDQNNNGPDSLDQQPVVGNGFGECNFNTFPMNGLEVIGCEGGFYTLVNFTIPTNTPQPSRYWLRICVPDSDRYWRTNSFTIVDGYQEIDMNGMWVCVEEPCGGCINPPSVVNFAASENSCTSVTFTWTPYDLDPDVDSLQIFQSALDTLVETVGKTQTPYVYSDAPVGEYGYLIRARKISAGDTCFSNTTDDNGTRFPPAVSPAACTATDDRCGNVIVSWTNPNNVTTVDSFKIFRNGVEVGNQLVGIQGQPNSDTITLATSATGFFTVRGWNTECLLGSVSAGDSGRAAIAPATPTGVTATTGQCAVTIRWNRVTGATGYRVMRDGVTSIGTPVDTFLVHEPPSPETLNAYTVIAIIEPNPTACEESAASLPANGSDIDPPPPPTSLNASDSLHCSHVAITWTDNSTNELGFIIQRGGTSIDSVGAGATSFNDSTAVPGTIYSYSVASYNQCGPSSFISAGTGVRKQVPPTVTITSASDNLPDRVTVLWVNTIRETGYRVLRNGATYASVGADITTYDDLGVVPGQVYAYSVLAFNDCGDGDTSAVDSGRVLANLNAPTNVLASDTNCTFVRVTWTDNNTAPQETGHEILRNGTMIGSVGVNVTTYDDLTAVRDSVYSYNVRATGPGGPATALVPDNGQLAPLPGTPTLSVDSVTCTDVHFAWTSGTFADTMLLFRDGAVMAAIPVVSGATGTTVSTPPDGLPHTYYAICANECGRGDTSDVLIAQRNQVPGTFSDLAGTSTDCNSVQLTWTSPPDADNLDVYANGVYQGSFAAWLTGTTIITGNGPADWQFYAIPQNECGAGDTSNVITVAVPQAPTTPTNVAASDTSCDFVYITWSAASGDVDGYTILEDGFNIASVLPGTLSLEHDPENSTVHEYSVFAYSETCGNSAPSATDEGNKVESAGPPVNLVTDGNSCDSITVMWQAASGAVEGYVIFLAEDSIDYTTNLQYVFVPAGGPGIYSVGVASYSSFCGTGTPEYASYQLFAQPEPVSNFAASNNRCDGVELTWDAYTGVYDGLLVYRNGSEIATAPIGATSFFDAGASLGGTHYALVTLSNLTGCIESDSATADGTVLQSPTAPQGVVASDTSCSNVHVTWSASTGAFSGYTIWRGTDSIGFVGAAVLEFTDTGILPGTTESYAVSAYDVLCGQSPLSSGDNGSRLLGPNPPSGVTATDGSCDNITVTWLAAAGDVTEYRVYRDGTLAGTVPVGTLEYVDVPASGTYDYTVTAFSTNCGETAPSLADEGTRLPTMGQLVMISASADSCGGILVTWAAYPGATSYRLYREGNAGVLAEINAPTTMFFDNSVLEGVAHSYTGTAVNVCNEGAPSDEVIGQRAQTPGMVTGLTATDNQISTICLSWDDVEGELAYNIYRDGALYASNGADDTSYCDINVSPGQVYVYSVGATNVCGVGALSDTAAGVAVFSLGQVQNLLATDDDCEQICMTWTDIENETGYVILRAAQPYDTVGADVTSYCDMSPTPGQCYSYTVRGFNVGGAGQPSNPSVGCRRDIPTAVEGTTASATNCSVVQLRWLDSDDEEEYLIFRNEVLLAQNPANDTTYDDATATPGVVYEYYVWSANECGVRQAGPVAQGVVAMVSADRCRRHCLRRRV
ncbi:MAG: fibronectin type III domain-containing protein [bacterium]|nr:fibronectin type III domain-containing protein [bacterium]